MNTKFKHYPVDQFHPLPAAVQMELFQPETFIDHSYWWVLNDGERYVVACNDAKLLARTNEDLRFVPAELLDDSHLQAFQPYITPDNKLYLGLDFQNWPCYGLSMGEFRKMTKNVDDESFIYIMVSDGMGYATTYGYAESVRIDEDELHERKEKVTIWM